MEALNYRSLDSNNSPNIKLEATLYEVLKTNHRQIRNIAEIIQRVAPDIILLNEFDNNSKYGKQSLSLFLNNYLAREQNGQQPINYPYIYQGEVNTGIPLVNETNIKVNKTLLDEHHGFGHYSGQYAMVLLSKYPIKNDKIKTFQKFKWRDMPGALKPINPDTGMTWYPEYIWQQIRLSSKSHWDIPIIIEGELIHILASHPTPPVFDGPENKNGKRNHDEIRFWNDYISKENHNYIYDDNMVFGVLSENSRFIIVGDLNASVDEGEAITNAIYALVNHEKIIDPKPESLGAIQHSKQNPTAKNHTTSWRMRADYVLPSSYGFNLKASGVFWPQQQSSLYKLINNRQASSDHRLVWVDLEITK